MVKPDGESLLLFGEAHAFPNREMATRGIQNVVLVNVLVPDGQAIDLEDVSMAVAHALSAAEKAGATSVAIPEIGTGHIAQFRGSAFKTHGDALSAILSGFLQYAERAERGVVKGTVKKVSTVTHGGPTPENIAFIVPEFEKAVATLQSNARRGYLG